MAYLKITTSAAPFLRGDSRGPIIELRAVAASILPCQETGSYPGVVG
jgi:hypothetical protein